MLVSLLLPLGIFAGALTTVAGMGGGVLLLLALSLLGSPAEALAMTAPSLLLGNLHRVVMHPREVDRRVATSFTLGALPGSLLGGALVTSLPTAVLRALLLAMTGLAVARALKRWSFQPPAALLTPAGFAVGALAAMGGGAGLLTGPILLSSGLTGRPYVATSSAIACAMHIGRLLSYGVTGLVTPAVLMGAAVLAVAILAGNVLGERARRHLSAELSGRIEIGVMILCVALAIGGAR